MLRSSVLIRSVSSASVVAARKFDAAMISSRAASTFCCSSSLPPFPSFRGSWSPPPASSSRCSAASFTCSLLSQLRFCSAAPSSCAITARLADVALGVIPPNGSWQRLSDVARQLPEDFFEQLPDDVAGLRGLLELCDPETVAVIEFRKSPATGQLEVARQPPRAFLAGHRARDAARQQAAAAPSEQPTTTREDGSGAASVQPPPQPRDPNSQYLTVSDALLHSAPPAPPARGDIDAAAQNAQQHKPKQQEQHEEKSFDLNEALFEMAPPAPDAGAIELALADTLQGVDLERSRLACLATFAVPIATAAANFRRLQRLRDAALKSNSTARAARATACSQEQAESEQHQQQDDDDAAPTLWQDVRDLVDSFTIGDASLRFMVDVFGPCADPWAELESRIRDLKSKEQQQSSATPSQDAADATAATEEAQDEQAAAAASLSVFDGFFVSILAPFQQSHSSFRVDDELAAHRAQEYDLYRLARFLSTEFFVTVDSIMRSDVQDILEKPVLHVIAAFPNHFEYVPPGVELPEGLTAASVDDVSLSAVENGMPPVRARIKAEDDGQQQATPTKEEVENATTDVAAPNNANSTISNSVNTGKNNNMGAVRYKLPAVEFANATKCSYHYRNATLDELRAALHLVLRANRRSKGTGVNNEDEDLGILRALPKGPGRQAAKQELTRALTLKRFPRGNVFLDRNVCAYFIFDTIPAEEAISFDDYKMSFLGASLRNMAPLYGNFPTSFPHLFVSFQDDRNIWFLQRADSTQMVAMKRPEEVTEEDMVTAIRMAKPKKLDPYRPFVASGLAYKLSKVTQKAIKLAGGMSAVIIRNKHVFTAIDEEGTFFFNDELTPEIVKTLGLPTRPEDVGPQGARSVVARPRSGDLTAPILGTTPSETPTPGATVTTAAPAASPAPAEIAAVPAVSSAGGGSSRPEVVLSVRDLWVELAMEGKK